MLLAVSSFLLIYDILLRISRRGSKGVMPEVSSFGSKISKLKLRQADYWKVYLPTVFENYVCDVKVDRFNVEAALWDTAGQEDYDHYRPLSYPDTHAFFICFAIDDPDSLANVQDKVSHLLSIMISSRNSSCVNYTLINI